MRFWIMGALIGFGLTAGWTLDMSSARAKDTSLKDQVAELLETGWQRSVKARAAAQKQYDQLRKIAPDDPRLPYAYALVQLRQLRYPEAARLLDEVLSQDKKNLTFWKVRAWLSVLTKEYDSALLEMQRLAELLPAEDALGDAETPYRQTAEFLGRLCAYLEGPVQASVDDRALDDCRQQILKRLTTTRKAAMEEGRKDLLQQFSGAVEETEKTSAEAKATAAKHRQQILGDLDRQQEELKTEATAAEARQAEVKKQLTYELEKIDTEQRRIVDTFRRLQYDAVALRRELATIDDRIVGLLDLAGREEDPLRKQRILDDAAHWRIMRHRPARALADVDARGTALNLQQAALVQQRREIEARWQREVGEVDKLRRSVDRIRNAKDKVQSQPVRGNTGQVRDLKSRSVALTTYLPLPINLEDERRRLLDEMR